MSTVLGNLVWVLPRPRLPMYPGEFPLHFEKRLWRPLGKPKMLLHMFGGKCFIGVRIDLKREVRPTIVADAHKLPFRDNFFDAVICDPPYSNELNQKLYGLSYPLKRHMWVEETERVLKINGFLVLYHTNWLPRPKLCSYWMRILVLPGQHHKARICTIFQKEEIPGETYFISALFSDLEPKEETIPIYTPVSLETF